MLTEEELSRDILALTRRIEATEKLSGRLNVEIGETISHLSLVRETANESITALCRRVGALEKAVGESISTGTSIWPPICAECDMKSSSKLSRIRAIIEEE